MLKLNKDGTKMFYYTYCSWPGTQHLQYTANIGNCGTEIGFFESGSTWN